MEHAISNAGWSQVVPLRNDCFSCGNQMLCLPCKLNTDQQNRMMSIIRPTREFRRGEAIYRIGDRFKSLFMIQSGSVKTQQLTVDGSANITGLFFEGEMIGLDAIGSDSYPCEAIATKPTKLCEVPYGKLEAMCGEITLMQRWLMGRLGASLRAQEVASTWTTRKQIELRVLSFFLNLYKRLVISKPPKDGFLALPLQKCDIALYLKMTPETFSRTLTQLRAHGQLEIRAGRFRLPDISAVEQLVGE